MIEAINLVNETSCNLKFMNVNNIYEGYIAKNK